MSTYLQLQNKVKKALNEDFKAKKLSFDDLMAILWILGQAKDEAEFKTVAEIYSSDYEALRYVLDQEQALYVEEKQEDVQKIVLEFMKENPKEATEVLKFISENKNVDLAVLSEKFPALKKYLA